MRAQFLEVGPAPLPSLSCGNSQTNRVPARRCVSDGPADSATQPLSLPSLQSIQKDPTPSVQPCPAAPLS